ncbi:origin recognition complex subunit 4 [Podochytrium sp. JEL0797]|nr:origin recognition complex subunit 4 [Podochytrium sp. JEL0797]
MSVDSIADPTPASSTGSPLSSSNSKLPDRQETESLALRSKTCHLTRLSGTARAQLLASPIVATSHFFGLYKLLNHMQSLISDNASDLKSLTKELRRLSVCGGEAGPIAQERSDMCNETNVNVKVNMFWIVQHADHALAAVLEAGCGGCEQLGAVVKEIREVAWESISADYSIHQAYTAIQSRLCGTSLPVETPGLEDSLEALTELAASSIVKGESNSVLLLGPRKSGKTTMIRKALAKFPSDKFVTVWLDGFFQTSDNLAVKEIVRQLQLEAQMECAKPTSVSECLKFVIDTLQSGTKENIPVVFVLEEFDLFALHPKQSLLYTLFDIAQTCVNPVFVIGASQRQDTIELLEKRVKSRFSHRVLFAYPPRDHKQLTTIVSQALTLSNDTDGLDNEAYLAAFNTHTEKLLASEGYKSVARAIVMGTLDVSEMFRIFSYMLISLSKSQPYFSSNLFKMACAAQLQSPTFDMFNAISPLEQALLVAIKQCLSRQIYQFNFEMVNEFFKDFLKTLKVNNLTFKKDVVFKAFESLQGLEIISLVDGSGNRCPKMHKMFKANLSVGDICEMIDQCEDCPDAVKEWCSS